MSGNRVSYTLDSTLETVNSAEETAGRMALAKATPLSHNDYKVQQAQTAVKRALLKAIGHQF